MAGLIDSSTGLCFGTGLQWGTAIGGDGLIIFSEPQLNINFLTGNAIVVDTTTPVNNFNGNINSLLTYTSPSTKYILNSSGILTPGTTLRTAYDSSGNPLGLLIEEQRTNLLKQSQAVATTPWISFAATPTNSVGVAPDGTSTACNINITGAFGDLANVTNGILAGTVLTASCYAKLAPSSPSPTVNLSSNNNTTWGTGASTTLTLTSDWQRMSITWTQTTTTNANVVIGALDVNGNDVPTQRGNVLIWGFQLEAGAFATSYIPTTTATVTRSADNITLATSKFPTATSGTVVVSTTLNTTPNSQFGLVAFDNKQITYANTGDPSVNAYDGTTAQLLFYSWTAGGNQKIGFAWGGGASTGYFNGGSKSTGTLGGFFSTTNLKLGQRFGSTAGSSYLKTLLVLPRKVTDADLQVLSTP